MPDRAETMRQLCIAAFSDDGHLSVDELDGIVAAGTVDGSMGPDEKHILTRLITRLTANDLNPQLWTRIEHLIVEYQLDDMA